MFRTLLTLVAFCCVTSSAFAQAVLSSNGFGFPPVPAFAPPPGATTPAAPSVPLVIDNHRLVSIQAGGFSAEWTGPQSHDRQTITRPGLNANIPVATNLEELQTTLASLERIHYNAAVADVNIVAQTAQAYAASHTSHKVDVQNHTTVNGTVNHVVSGTVNVQNDQPACAQDTACGSTYCGCGHQRTVYRSYQYGYRYYRCWRTGAIRRYGY